MKLRKNIKAFTLVELIVTMAVLGVLVLLAVPSLLSYTEQAKLTRIQHDTRIMENKIAEVFNQDNNYNEWDDNEKDLGTLILRNQLFEKEGIASFVDRSYLRRNIASSENKVELAQNENELGLGGDLHELSEESKGYKVIPEIYEKEINTRLNGTFYSNKNGKVYYEPNKPLPSIKNENLLACLAAEGSDYEFSVINGKGTITGYNGTLTHLYIPSAFLVNDECVPVQVIGAGAFRNGTYTRVYIPESVKTIEENAFQGGQLIEVDIPHSVNSVGPNAFSNNPIKENGIIVNSSESSVSIDSIAFSGLTSGSSIIYRTPTADKLKITVQTEVDSEGRRTGTITGYYGDSYRGSQSTGSSNVGSGSSGNFNNVISIPSVIIINGETVEITEVAQGAYQGRGIIHVEFPETLERIEDYAFAGNQLVEVTIPSKVKYIGNYAFAFNEVILDKNSKASIGNIVVANNNYQYLSDINDLGNLAPGGTETRKVSNTSLLDHVFIVSSAGFEIPEEYNPVNNEENDEIEDDKEANEEPEMIIPSPAENKKVPIHSPVNNVVFYGEVATSDLMSGSQLANAVGLTSGSSINSNEPWLSYKMSGKQIYVAKKPYRNNISWNILNNLNLIYGRKINIDGNSYMLRVLKGSTVNPHPINDNSMRWRLHNSEWNRLFVPIHEDSIDNSFFFSYNVSTSSRINHNLGSGRLGMYNQADLGMGVINGSHRPGATNILQEHINSSNNSDRLGRGHSGVSSASRYSAGFTDRTIGWRPVLELIE